MPIVRLPGGYLRDEIRLPLFDTIILDAGESPVGTRQFFSDVQGKPNSMTNLKQNNMLETAVSYRVLGMAIDAQNIYYDNYEALALIMENSSLRLHIGEKDYWQGPMLFAAGRLKQNSALAAATTVAATTIENATTYQHFGDEAVQGILFPGDHFVDINPLQSFFVEWVCGAGSGDYAMTAAEITASTPAANTRIRFMMSLKGLLRRPVQ